MFVCLCESKCAHIPSSVSGTVPPVVCQLIIIQDIKMRKETCKKAMEVKKKKKQSVLKRRLILSTPRKMLSSQSAAPKFCKCFLGFVEFQIHNLLHVPNRLLNTVVP